MKLRKFKVGKLEWPYNHYIEDLEGNVIAKLRMTSYSTSDKTLADTLKHSDKNIQVVKDANLLAASPDMLRALIAIVDAQYKKGGTLAALNGRVSKAKKLIEKLK